MSTWRRGDRGRGEEQHHLDRAADAGAEDHGAAARRHRDALLVQVVELQRGAADAVRGDEVEEAARELGQDRGDEREVGVHAAQERGGPRGRDERVQERARARPSPRSRSRTRFCTDAQSMSLRLGIAIASARRMPASIPMLTRLRRLILSGATSSTPAAAAVSCAQRLQLLGEVLDAATRAGGQRGGLDQRDRPRRSVPCRATRWPRRSLGWLRPARWARRPRRRHPLRGRLTVARRSELRGRRRAGTSRRAPRQRRDCGGTRRWSLRRCRGPRSSLPVGLDQQAIRCDAAVGDPRAVELVERGPRRGERSRR